MSGKPTSGAFEKTAGWLDWTAGPSRPRLQLPAGAVDAVFSVRYPDRFRLW